MTGLPTWFDVTNIEILAPGGASGDPMKSVIRLNDGGDPFDLLVTFQADNTTWWGLAEALSSINPTMLPEVFSTFLFENIGLGPDFEAANPVGTVLTPGGNPGGGPAGTSVYQARLNIPNADAFFVDTGGNLAPAAYMLGANIEWDLQGFSNWFATATLSQPIMIKVALNN